MSRWQTKVSDHKIHAALKELRDCVSGQISEPAEGELAERRRFEKVIAAYQRTLGKLDPEFVPSDVLDANLSHLNQHVLPQARLYRDKRDFPNLVSANDQLSNLLQQLAIFQAMSGEIDTAPAITDLEGQMDSFAASIVQEQQAAEKELQRLLDASAQQEQKLADLGAKIETRNQEIDARTSEWQSQFSQAQENRSTDYNNWRQEINESSQSKIREIIDRTNEELRENEEKHNERSSEIQHRFEAEIDDYLDRAKADYEAIRTLHGLAAEDSVGGGYVSNARKEGEVAIRWRRISVAFICFAAVWLFYSFWSRDGQFSWEAALMSIPLTFVLLAGAAYCAQQSTRHRNVEVQNRRFALEMAAIDPYLQSLPEADRVTLKKELTARYFGQMEHSNGPSAYDEHEIKRVLEALGQNILKPFADIAKTFK